MSQRFVFVLAGGVLAVICIATSIIYVNVSSQARHHAPANATTSHQLLVTTATPSIDPAILANCGFSADSANFPDANVTYYNDGQFLIELFALPQIATTFMQLPADIPLRPFALKGSSDDKPPYFPSFVSQTALLLPFNQGKPVLQLAFVACGTRTANVSMKMMQVHLDQFTAYSGQLSTWAIDCTRVNYYTRQNGVGFSECVSSVNDTEYHATFTSTQAGSVATLSSATAPFPRDFPAPNVPSLNEVFIDGMTAPGIYTFSLSFVDANNVNHAIPAPLSIFTAPSKQNWSGQACLANAMQPQIPLISTDRYICPDASSS